MTIPIHALIITLLWLYCTGSAIAGPAGKLLYSSGNIDSNSAPSTQFAEQHIFSTSYGESHAIILDDETLLRVDENSAVTVESVESATAEGDNQTRLTLNRGQFWLLNKKPAANVLITTPRAVIGIRGTELNISYQDGMSRITALEGNALISNSEGSIPLNAGEIAVIQKGALPVKQHTLTPRDAVQWTVMVPSLFSSGLLQQAANPEQATQIWNHIREKQFNTAISLAQQQLAKQPADAITHLLHAFSLLLTGATDSALVASSRATTLRPQLADGWVIHAATLQSALDLQQAEAANRTAIMLHPTHTIAHLQLAQILFGTGRNREAEALLSQLPLPEDGDIAAELLATRGFIALARHAMEEAEQLFTQSIELHRATATPHLGLGLLFARSGQTEKAQSELTHAVLLEPRRAIYRSYWAKILYQIGRHQEALEVLEISQHIDPNDPTPQLYRALILHDLNRPVEAIAALHEAVRMNDNRAIFRSRSLLDKDLAVKNSNLARLYNQLGLSGWGFSRATQAVEEDITNAAAHLFLANSYSEDGDRSFNENGENLIARLMQPANNNTFNSFNDYTTFLEQPAVEQNGEIHIGNHEHIKGLWAVSGFSPSLNIAWQQALIHHSTDGWRESNSERSSALIHYAKWDISSEQSLMGVLSATNQRRDGATYPRYEADAEQQHEAYQFNQIRRLEIGLHQRLSEQQHRLYHLGCFNNRFSGVEQVPPATLYQYHQQRPHCQLQGRWIIKDGTHHSSYGAVFFDGDERSEWTLSSGAGSGTPSTSIRSSTLFANHQIQLSPHWRLEADLHLESLLNSNTTLSGVEWKQRQVHPSIGMIYQPTPSGTLRIAHFQRLTPFYSGSGRLDTLSIAGIPTLRNGAAGTEADEWVLRWEQDWGDQHLTAEWFDRQQHQLIHYSDNPDIALHHQNHSGSAHGYSFESSILLGKQSALRARYDYQSIRDQANPAADRDQQTVQLSLNWRNRDGHFGKISQLLRNIETIDPSRGDETIPLTHLELGLEFPQKQGQLSIQIKNLLNRSFNWISSPYDREGEIPERQVLFSVTLHP